MSKLRWIRDVENRKAVLKDTNGTVAEFTLDGIPSNVVTWLTLYGLSQVLSDRTASIPKADMDVKLKRMDEVYEQLKTGHINMEREAVITRYKRTLAQVKELIAQGKHKEAQKLLSQL